MPESPLSPNTQAYFLVLLPQASDHSCTWPPGFSLQRTLTYIPGLLLQLASKWGLPGLHFEKDSVWMYVFESSWIHLVMRKLLKIMLCL